MTLQKATRVGLYEQGALIPQSVTLYWNGRPRMRERGPAFYRLPVIDGGELSVKFHDPVEIVSVRTAEVHSSRLYLNAPVVFQFGEGSGYDGKPIRTWTRDPVITCSTNGSSREDHSFSIDYQALQPQEGGNLRGTKAMRKVSTFLSVYAAQTAGSCSFSFLLD